MREDEAYDMAAARKLWESKKVGGKKKADRKAKRKELVASVDKRSLRATGRTDQFNFRTTPEMKAKAQEAAKDSGMSIAEWMEEAVAAYLAGSRGGGDAA
jgi:predicted HicB family RNase H-like nuclease